MATVISAGCQLEKTCRHLHYARLSHSHVNDAARASTNVNTASARKRSLPIASINREFGRATLRLADQRRHEPRRDRPICSIRAHCHRERLVGHGPLDAQRHRLPDFERNKVGTASRRSGEFRTSGNHFAVPTGLGLIRPASSSAVLCP